MYSVLILVVLFSIATIYPKCMYKNIFCRSFRFSAKEAVLLLPSCSSLHIAISKYVVL